MILALSGADVLEALVLITHIGGFLRDISLAVMDVEHKSST